MKSYRAVIVLAFLPLVLAAPAGAASKPTPTATVPVLVCPTEVMADTVPTPVASSARVPASAAHLVVYSSINGYIQVLGLRDWVCEAGVGSDGAGITVAPSTTEGIGGGGVEAAANPGGCQGCLLGLACPFFPAALKAMHTEEPGEPCTRQPLGQVTHQLSAYAVAFADPAGETVSMCPGPGERPTPCGIVPSDSPYPTNGVVIYWPYGSSQAGKVAANNFAADAVCVLPASEHATCTVILNEFLATQMKRL
jgi:hypothetical protein